MKTFYKAEIVKIITLPLYFTKTNDSLPLYFFNHEKYITFYINNSYLQIFGRKFGVLLN